MVNVLDVMEKALTGPRASERDYDLKIFWPKLKEVIEAYDIRYDQETVIPNDDSLADDIFKAGLDFYCDVGTYCKDTERIIKFDENEIKEGLIGAPSKASFGEGVDAKIMLPRKPESKTPPWCYLGAVGTPVSSEQILLGLTEAYGSIPLADSISVPVLTSVAGMRIRPNSPLEILGAIRTVVLAREALRRAGRPGLPIMNAVSTAESASALIAATHPNYGLRPSDGYPVGSTAELKIDFERLNKICAVQSFGGRIEAFGFPMLGGYCGGPEGTAITGVAYFIQGALVQQGTWSLVHPTHIKYACCSDPKSLWAESALGQAISRNTNLLAMGMSFGAAGPCTEMCLNETAAMVISVVVSGPHIEAAGVAKGAREDYQTPMERKFSAELAHSVAGMKRGDANDIVKALVATYADRIADPPPGKRYQECFDIQRGKPSQEYLEIYNKVKKELEGIGLEFIY